MSEGRAVWPEQECFWQPCPLGLHSLQSTGSEATCVSATSSDIYAFQESLEPFRMGTDSAAEHTGVKPQHRMGVPRVALRELLR